jgi:hypothetical protein
MKFGMKVIPLDASPKVHFFISQLVISTWRMPKDARWDDNDATVVDPLRVRNINHT